MNNGAHSLSPSASCRGRAAGHPEIIQPLEKNFPIIGKIRLNFPTIGKKLSNHWKTSPASPREHPSRIPALSALLCFPSSSLPYPFAPFVSFVAEKSPPSRHPSRFPIRFFRRSLFTFHFSLFTSTL
ncbi:MAG: hypothetical protein IKO01_08100 [Kiritimatiellae bacterium]|nr:hypothetical protein [Kiritimatiellia bacterium]